MWYEVDLQSGRRGLMGRLSKDLRLYGISSHYGLVAWTYDGEFHRLTVKAESRVAPPGEKTSGERG